MISAVFVDRPRLAIVISILITLAGLIALAVIPIAQFPDIVPPEVSVTTSLSRRQRRSRRTNRRPGHRERDQRRRRHALHALVLGQ